MFSSWPKFFIVFNLLCAIISVGYAQDARDSLVGKPVPALRLQTLDGKTYKLDSLKGKTIVINLFYKNCGFCLQEITFLNDVSEKYKENKDIVFIAISSRDDSTQLRKFLKKNNFNFEIVPSEFSAKGKNWKEKTNTKMLYENFGTNSFPTTIIVDKSGIIIFYRIGFNNTETFKSDFLAGLEKTL